MADVAVAAERLGFMPGWSARLLAALADRLAVEGERRLLWLPVFFGMGIGVYVALKVEPPLWPAVGVAVAGTGLALALRRHALLFEAALALTVFAAGFALIRETAWEREAPTLQRHLGSMLITGRVIDIDLLDKGWRVIIAPDPLPGLDPKEHPRRLRLHIPQTRYLLNPGDRGILTAILY